MRWRLGCLIVLMLLMFARLSAAAQSTPAFEYTDCPFDLHLTHTIDCGYLTVPENYEQPQARPIRLAVAILRHPSDNPASDPIIYLEGGPGGNVLTFLRDTLSTRYEPFFNAQRDMIIFDQRGVGLSEPALECVEFNNLAREIAVLENVTRAEVYQRQQEALTACGTSLSAQYDLSQYSSANSARDIEALRMALGYEQVNLWGVSYGTRLALTMMRDYPDSLRSVVLDSAYPLEVNLFTDSPANGIRALNALFDACAANENCHDAYPDLRERFLATVAELQLQPVRTDWYSMVELDGIAYYQANIGLLSSAHDLPFLPSSMWLAGDGVYQGYAQRLYETWTNPNGVSMGQYFAVQCREEIAFTEQAAIEAADAAQPELQTFLTEALPSRLAICASFQTGQAPAIENQAVVSDIPTLILGGHFDPITPPAWGRLVQSQLLHSTFIEFPTLSHAVLDAHECPRQIAIDFFLSPNNVLDTSCVDDMEMFFYVPEHEPSMPTM